MKIRLDIFPEVLGAALQAGSAANASVLFNNGSAVGPSGCAKTHVLL